MKKSAWLGMYAIGLVLTFVAFQNCSNPNADAERHGNNSELAPENGDYKVMKVDDIKSSVDAAAKTCSISAESAIRSVKDGDS